MTITEASKILTLINAAYPRFYSNTTKEDKQKATIVWQRFFADQPEKIVNAAVQMHIANSEFPPTIAEINSNILKITQPKEMTEVEAWGFISKALKNSLYNSRAEFDKLPPLLQGIIGSPQVLKDWALVDEADVQTVIQSNFMRSYKAKARAAKEYQAIPNEIKNLIGELSEKMALTAGKEES